MALGQIKSPRLESVRSVPSYLGCVNVLFDPGRILVQPIGRPLHLVSTYVIEGPDTRYDVSKFLIDPSGLYKPR
jgi:hypothetical protein